jgi:hypothetical protein
MMRAVKPEFPNVSHRGLAIAMAVTIFFAASAFISSAQAAEIEVSWLEVQQQVRPKKATGHTRKAVRLTLAADGKVAEHYSATNRRGQANTGVGEGRFRETIGPPKRGRVSWQVENQKTLVRSWDREQHVEIIRVTANSDSSCRAEISFRLKPGFREYLAYTISSGKPAYHSAISATQVKCTVLSQ